ncbi:MAG: DUF3501 family protein [Aquificaceae bacterium]|nr:DUF3501 family protein [Aquificaceae bacterium]MCX8059899.1 DUF3501 family protein [Aquificaceae bacterium]MDW8096744.1 DUF3501 family protein [Aquificaceae bacterium]
MRKVSREEILNIYEYEKVRPQKVQEIIELKKHRRVFIEPWVHLVFENRDTVWFQVQEMIRAERMVREEEIQHELEVYNELVPDRGELSVTMFIEIPEASERRRILPQLVGIHDHLYFHIGGKHTVRALPDERSKEDYEYGKAAVVHFLKVKFTDEQVEDFKREEVRIEISHPNYRALTILPQEVKAELIKDLTSE